MIKKITIKNNISQIIALTEKNVKLNSRFKLGLAFHFINPIISILLPIIIMGKFFEFNALFAPWNETNFLVYIFLAYNINLIIQLITLFPNQFREEKYWKTFPALIIAPFYRFNMLVGILFSHLIMISIPFIVFFIICAIYYPISFFTIIAVIVIFFLITLIFSGIGLILGIFAISKESLWRMVKFFFNILFWLSCITYPFQVFPGVIQNIINLNPLYYVFNFLRFAWIENDIFYTINFHLLEFILLISTSIILPTIGIFVFNQVYKKFGIVGY